MFAQNPKKEFVVTYNIENVRQAILKINEFEPNYYVIVKDDKILNEIRLLQKGQLLDFGFHVDFDLTKISDNETKVSIEVSRNLGAINTASEVSIANNSLKSITSKFSAYLSGDINERILEISKKEGRMAAITFATKTVGWDLKKSMNYVDDLIGTPEKDRKGCFIATACYGDYNSREVMLLREYRDTVLMKNTIGKLFIKLYYTVSPSIAKRIEKSHKLKNYIRNKILKRIIRLIEQRINNK